MTPWTPLIIYNIELNGIMEQPINLDLSFYRTIFLPSLDIYFSFVSRTDIPCLEIEISSSNSWTENAPSPPPSLIQLAARR